jgi:hypothetical protein
MSLVELKIASSNLRTYCDNTKHFVLPETETQENPITCSPSGTLCAPLEAGSISSTSILLEPGTRGCWPALARDKNPTQRKTAAARINTIFFFTLFSRF